MLEIIVGAAVAISALLLITMGVMATIDSLFRPDRYDEANDFHDTHD